MFFGQKKTLPTFVAKTFVISYLYIYFFFILNREKKWVFGHRILKTRKNTQNRPKNTQNRPKTPLFCHFLTKKEEKLWPKVFTKVGRWPKVLATEPKKFKNIIKIFEKPTLWPKVLAICPLLKIVLATEMGIKNTNSLQYFSNYHLTILITTRR